MGRLQRSQVLAQKLEIIGGTRVARLSAKNVNSDWVSNDSYGLAQKLFIVGGFQ